MRPRALPVESHIGGDQVVIRADCLGSIRKTPEWPKETEFHIAGRGYGLSQRDDIFGRRES
jgi:hypothetical protein